jgi:hypothetical protein
MDDLTHPTNGYAARIDVTASGNSWHSQSASDWAPHRWHWGIGSADTLGRQYSQTQLPRRPHSLHISTQVLSAANLAIDLSRDMLFVPIRKRSRPKSYWIETKKRQSLNETPAL